MEKCEHGVYNPDAPRPARYCQSCTPGVHDRTLQGLPKFKPSKAERRDSPVLRVDTFLAQPVGVRLAEAREYEG